MEHDNKALNYGATLTGGGLGLEQIFESIDALTQDGATGQEWIALVKGIFLIVFGYFAWKRAKAPTPAPVQPS